MSKKNKLISEEKILEEIKHFRQQQKSLIMATQSAADSPTQQPLASYAPFIEDEACFYLFLSGLASHSINLKNHDKDQTRVSILLIEDEQDAGNIFARKRLNYSCQVSIWPRNHPQWQEKIDKLQVRFGKIIELLSSLDDFNLYCLIPEEGHYVRGFGQAYELKDGKKPILINK